jgi:hypothetical protein
MDTLGALALATEKPVISNSYLLIDCVQYIFNHKDSGTFIAKALQKKR